jgi:hypothetical protein
MRKHAKKSEDAAEVVNDLLEARNNIGWRQVEALDKIASTMEKNSQ